MFSDQSKKSVFRRMSEKGNQRHTMGKMGKGRGEAVYLRTFEHSPLLFKSVV